MKTLYFFFLFNHLFLTLNTVFKKKKKKKKLHLVGKRAIEMWLATARWRSRDRQREVGGPITFRSPQFHLEMFYPAGSVWRCSILWHEWTGPGFVFPIGQTNLLQGGDSGANTDWEGGILFFFLVCLSLTVSTAMDSNAVKSLSETEEPCGDWTNKTPWRQKYRRAKISPSVPPTLTGRRTAVLVLFVFCQTQNANTQNMLSSTRVLGKPHVLLIKIPPFTCLAAVPSSTGVNRKIPLPPPLLSLTLHGIFLIIQRPTTVLRMNKLVISLG